MKSFRRITATKQDAAGALDIAILKQEKAGYLQTFSNKTFLSRDKWKQRYYVLHGSKLYRFYKKEDVTSIPTTSNSRCRIINLADYDICQHVPESDCKREHVFILDGANSGLDQVKYMFSANTKEEMQDWISHLRKAIFRNRENKRPQRPPRSKVTSLPVTSQETQKNDGDTTSLVDPETPSRLYNATKYRVRGPKGRRLPQKKSRQFRDGNDKFISSSLCELDLSHSEEDLVRPSRLRRSGANSPPLRDRANSFGNLAYQYSSSDDSLFKERHRNGGKMDVTRISEADEDVDKSMGMKADVVTSDDLKKVDTKSPVIKEKVAVASDTSGKSKSYVVTVDFVEKTEKKPVADRVTSVEPGPSQQSVGPVIYLSAKLLEMSGCLSRFQHHATEELHMVKEHLADVNKKLLEYPPGSTQVDTISTQAAMDLKTTEDDLETLLNITSRIEKSLQQVKDECDQMLNHI